MVQLTSIQYEEIICKFEQEIAKLKQQNKELTYKIIELEDKLNLNSSNSNLPTSREIYRIERKRRAKSDKKPGGQAGHKYNGYKFKEPDQLIEVFPKESSCKCGGSLVLDEESKSHQKIEIPLLKPYVTEYKLHHKVCTKCKRKYKAKLDNYRLLGTNLQSIIGSLGGFFNNSKRDIQEILSKIFNIDLSLGLISVTEGRISARLENKYNELKEVAQNSNHLHLDETSSNNKGKRHWCWIAANKMVTVFKLSNSRGQKVIAKFLPDYEGKVISDRYGVYNVFNKEDRQICLAHLRRDFKRLAHSKDKELSEIGIELLDTINAVFRLYKLDKSKEMERLRYLELMWKVKDRMLYYLEAVAQMNHRKQAKRVANNILKSFEMMWLFVENEQIEPTNNFAERQIKHHVKYRKNSFFTWSDRGDRFLERVKSLYASSKLQNLNPVQQLLASI